MTRPLLLTVLVGVAAAAAGCDSALNPEPFGIETIENQLATPEGAVVFVNSLYQPLPGLYGSFGAPMATILETGTDDGWPFAQQFGGYKSREIDSSTGQLSNIYENSFDGIARANIYLAREGAIDFTGREALGNQLRGEARFLRAFYYFNLVRLFGDVALYTEPALTPLEGQKPRSATAEVYAQIKADLQAAADLLPAAYTGSGLAGERGRATSGAARAVLGKVHLTLEEWQSVLDVTAPISGYSLRPNYVDNFYGLILSTAGENRVESMFEVQFSAQGPGPKSQLRVSYTPRQVRDGQNQIMPTDNNYLRSEVGAYGENALAQAFEAGDARAAVTLDKFGATRVPVTTTYPVRDAAGNVVTNPDGSPKLQRELFVRKWYSDISNQETAWNIPLFRYAEVLLIRAEAFAELGQTGSAVPLVNQVRQRAGLAPLAADVDVVQAVRRERRTELAFEHKRLFDLNRWGILPQALALQGVQIDPAKVTPHPITRKPQVLYPMPDIELQRNPNATQNPGY